MARTGGCLCGETRFEIDIDPVTTGACHCSMCRRISGGVFLAVRVPPGSLRFTRKDGHRVFTSSRWAERGFCGTCGSTLYYRVTAPGSHHGTWSVALGALDDPAGIVLDREIYIDQKPDGYAFAGDHSRMTEAEVLKMFGLD